MNTTIVLPTEIGEGPEREVQTLLADSHRRLALISLRRSAFLADHSAQVPITIQAVLGKGRLNVAGNDYTLTPGVIMPVDAHVVHHVEAQPDVVILVTFFRQPKTAIGEETATQS